MIHPPSLTAFARDMLAAARTHLPTEGGGMSNRLFQPPANLLVGAWFRLCGVKA